MKPSIGILLALSFFLLASCQKKAESSSSSDISAADAVAHAEADARRAHLPGDLEEAQSNPKKIAQVYRDAVELGDTATQRLADKKLSAIIIPQVERATWEGSFRRFRKNAPEGSATRKRLEEIFQSKRNDFH